MTGAFVFDGPMYCDCNGVYCNTTVTNEMLDRYYHVIDILYVVMRTIHIDKTYEEARLQKLEIGAKLHVIEIPNFLTPKNFLSRNKYTLKIKNILSKSDLVFLRIPSVLCNMAAAICRQNNKPYFAEVGGCAWDSYFNHGLLGKIIAPYMFFLQRKVVRDAAFASYVTEKWLQNRYPTRGQSIVASNVYLSEFNEDSIRSRIAKYKDHRPIYRIGTIASVEVRYKGQEFIIRALSRLKKQGIILEYDLVGAGDPVFLKRLAVKYGVVEQVHFLGVKLHSEIWSWLDTIDIYAQPSKQEGLPRAVIEAMNRGCLTIGSDTAGIPELLEDDMVFKSGSVSDICKVIYRLLNEKDFSRRILRNFSKSKGFSLDDLNQRRNEAFSKYKNIIINEKR